METVVISSIRFYQSLTRVPVVQNTFFRWSGCRSWPTCSEYTILMIREHGVFSGVLKGIRRLSQCHSF